jgi:hypothetical protein
MARAQAAYLTLGRFELLKDLKANNDHDLVRRPQRAAHGARRGVDAFSNKEVFTRTIDTHLGTRTAAPHRAPVPRLGLCWK